MALAIAVTLVLGGSLHAVPILYTDAPFDNTQVFRDYNSSPDTNVTYAPAPFPAQSVSGGLSTWTYGTGVSDPKIIYNDGAGSTPHAEYPWVRLRYQQSPVGGVVQVWENPAQGGESTNFAGSASLVEATGNPDTTGNAPPTPNGTGFRIDPEPSTANGDTFTADYVLIDRYQTQGLGEWDAAGDLQGWATPNITGPTVTGSLLSGTGNGDAQITSGPGFDADTFEFVEIRMRSSGSPAQLFWATGGSYVGGQSVTLGTGDNSFHTYIIDFSGESTWNGANMQVRLDPVSGGGSPTFDVDYIRVRTNAMVVPEPSSLLLAAFGLVGLLVGRRRAGRRRQA